MKKLFFWLFVIAVVVAGGWWWLNPDEGPATSLADVTRRGVVTQGDLTVSISSVGAVEPIRTVEIKSKASGEIVKLTVEEGDYVEAGDLLVRLDPTTVRNEYDQAEADYNVAQVTLEQRKREMARQKDLFERKLISELDYDDARLAYEQANSQFVRARANLSTSSERLEDTEIRSPIDGLVLTRSVEEGQIISSGISSVTGGTQLYMIADMTQVYVIADVDETDIGRVQIGLPARVVADAYPDQKFSGTVTRVAPLAKVEQNVTMFEVTVLVDNEEGMLKAGMSSDIEMVIDEALDAILIPAGAVQTRMPDWGQGRGDRKGGDSTLAHGDSSRMQMGHGAQNPGERSGQWSGHSSGGMGGSRHAGGKRRMPPMQLFVQVVKNGETTEQSIKVGLTNLDFAQILEGVQPGDSLVWSLTSGAMAGREQFMQRMRNWNSVPGMRRRR